MDAVGDPLALLLLRAHHEPEQMLALSADALELGHLLYELVVDHAQLLTLKLRTGRSWQRQRLGCAERLVAPSPARPRADTAW